MIFIIRSLPHWYLSKHYAAEQFLHRSRKLPENKGVLNGWSKVGGQATVKITGTLCKNFQIGPPIARMESEKREGEKR
jgi:hypothetical protein